METTKQDLNTKDVLINMSSDEYRVFMEETFPWLYKDLVDGLDMTKTCMCWGFEVGPGWREIIYNLSVKLEPICKASKGEIRAAQVKEKFGGLRFYMSSYGTDDAVQKLTGDAEDLACVTCEVCGEPGKTYTNGWHITLCPIHAKEKNKL